MTRSVSARFFNFISFKKEEKEKQRKKEIIEEKFYQFSFFSMFLLDFVETKERYKNILTFLVLSSYLPFVPFINRGQKFLSLIPLSDSIRLIGLQKFLQRLHSRGMISLIHEEGRENRRKIGRRIRRWKSVVMDDFKSPPSKLIEGALSNVE